MSSRRLTLVCALVLSPWCAIASAQDNEILTQLYGTGVHAFFAGDYKTAYDDLTAVIDRGTSDPRAYYFRAVSYLKLGRPDEAKADMAKGAELESADLDGAYNVGRALERVQGSPRLALEKYRLQARLAAHARQQQADRQKYEAVRNREKAVIRTYVSEPIDGGPAAVAETGETVTPTTAETPVDTPAAETATTSPFGDDPVEKPVAETPAATNDDNPFGGAATPAEDTPAAAPNDDNPFGGAAADAPAGDEPEMKKEDAPADDNNPFGDAPAGDAPAADTPAAEPNDDNPFGGAADAPAGDEPEMKKEDAPADDNNPFGDAPAADAPAADAPAADNPFGDAPAADAPAADNPFGDEPAADEPEMKKEAEPADNNPFGDDTAEEKPAEAAEDNNPFGDPAPADAEKPAEEKPATEPAEDDNPFE